MNVPVDLQQRVLTKTNQCITLIEQTYGFKFSKIIRIRFDIRGARIAGQAVLNDFVMRINPAFLVAHPDKMIEETIPHELAHLAIHEIYYLGKNQVVDAHGYEWKQMMRKIGADDSRTHDLEIDSKHAIHKTKYGYKCSVCSAPIPVGSKIHTNIQRGKQYTPRCCGRSANLVYVGVIGQVSNKDATQKIANNEIKTPTKITNIKRPDPNSKLGKCFLAYEKYHKKSDWGRRDWISYFVTEFNCTPAGAATYYASIIKLIS